MLTGESWAEAIARPILFGWAPGIYGVLSSYIAGIFFLSFVADPAHSALRTPCASLGALLTLCAVSVTVCHCVWCRFVVICVFVLINVVVAVLLEKMVSDEVGYI